MGCNGISRRIRVRDFAGYMFARNLDFAVLSILFLHPPPFRLAPPYHHHRMGCNGTRGRIRGRDF
jgi:hypothetical protein